MMINVSLVRKTTCLGFIRIWVLIIGFLKILFNHMRNGFKVNLFFSPVATLYFSFSFLIKFFFKKSFIQQFFNFHEKSKFFFIMVNKDLRSSI